MRTWCWNINNILKFIMKEDHTFHHSFNTAGSNTPGPEVVSQRVSQSLSDIMRNSQRYFEFLVCHHFVLCSRRFQYLWSTHPLAFQVTQQWRSILFFKNSTSCCVVKSRDECLKEYLNDFYSVLRVNGCAIFNRLGSRSFPIVLASIRGSVS